MAAVVAASVRRSARTAPNARMRLVLAVAVTAVACMTSLVTAQTTIGAVSNTSSSSDPGNGTMPTSETAANSTARPTGDNATQEATSASTGTVMTTDNSTDTNTNSSVPTTPPYIPIPVDTDETASFIYAGAGVGVLMVGSLGVILTRSFYIHRGSYDLKRQMQQQQPEGTASPQFPPIPLSVYNDTPREARHSVRRSWRSSREVEEPVPPSAGATDGGTLVNPQVVPHPLPSAPTSPPTAPTAPRPPSGKFTLHQSQFTSVQGAPDLEQSGSVGADSSMNSHGTLSSNAPLIERLDSSASLRPTPKERASLRKKSRAPQLIDEAADTDPSRPAPRPRSSIRSRAGTHGSSGNPRAPPGDQIGSVIANRAAERTLSASQQPKAHVRGTQDAGEPRPPAAVFQRNGVAQPQLSPARMPTRPPPVAPSVPAHPPPPLPEKPPTAAVASRPSNASSAHGSQPATVPFLHFDLTLQTSNESQMTYAASQRPGSFIIDL